MNINLYGLVARGISLFACAFVATIAECGEGVLDASPTESAVSRNGLRIWGTVKDMTPDISEESFSKIESKIGTEEFQMLAHQMLNLRIASDAMVTLRGASVTKKVVADSQGNFEFSGLPAGDYELSAAAPSYVSAKGIRQTAVGRKRVRLQDFGDTSILGLSAFTVSVEGRITDSNGQPVAGAKVTGRPVPFEKNADSNYSFNQEHQYDISATSAADGTYELHGFFPPSIYEIGLIYLRDNGKFRSFGTSVEIHVAAAEFTQSEENIPRVPLVTQELLVPARRLRDLLMRSLSQQEKEKLQEKFRERKDLPASKGNTITGVDVVLTKVEPGAK